MSLFEKLFGGKGPITGRHVREKWDALDGSERVKKLVLPLLEQVATAVGATETRVAHAADDRSDGELRGLVGGYPFRIHVSWSGSTHVELRYEDELDPIDLELDPNEATASAAPVGAWDESEQRSILAPGISIRGRGSDRERARFEALPSDARARILGEIRAQRVSYLRSRTGELTAAPALVVNKLEDPVANLAGIVKLAHDLAVARGAVPATLPGAPIDPERPFAGWRHRAREDRWPLAAAFAETVAARTGGRVVARRHEGEIDARWVEGDDALRVAVNLSFDHLAIEAQARGVEGSFELLRDPRVKMTESHVGDAWDEDGYVFYAPSVYLLGDEEDVRAEAAVLGSLPPDRLTELLATMESLALDRVALESSALETRFRGIARTPNAGIVVEVARVLGRVARAFPRGAAPDATRDRAVRCKYCRAVWFPAPGREMCAQCGAPS